MSLIPLMKLRLAAPKHLIDVNGIADLSYIREADGHLAIGASTRESDLDESELIRTKYPIIAEPVWRKSLAFAIVAEAAMAISRDTVGSGPCLE